LKSRALVALVRGLEEFDSAHQAVAELIDEPERARYVEALASLHRSALLRER
jgi:predicted metal-dependent enzyme (double-stranded beta helix superfamily)